MSDANLTALTNEELAELWREAMTEEDVAVRAQNYYFQQVEKDAGRHIPYAAEKRARAVEAAKNRRLAIEEEQRRRSVG